MASLSLADSANIEAALSHGPPRHARKHSRHPTAAAPLPSFSFNPGVPTNPDVEDTKADDKDQENLDMGGSGHMRRPSKPAPLPDFSFNPGAAIPSAGTPSPTHPILEEMAMNQQRVSKSAKPAPLPAFTFNPGTMAGASSPTKLEHEEDFQKIAGHRRGNSEFVGGKAEAAQLISTSPAKHDPRSSGPPVSTLAFKGHTHRRSQAISVSDIDTSDLIKQHALAKARAPSNPSTPQESSFSFPRASPGQRYQQSATTRSPSSSPRRGGSISGFKPRAVDFSDTVDVIPRLRPLSMISSETERSNSTIRGHSLSNSINSIASPLPTSPPDGLSISSPSMTETVFDRRPNTADPALLLNNASTVKKETMLSMPKRPLSASGSPMVSSSGSPPSKKKHFWSAQELELTPSPTPQYEEADPFDHDIQESVPVQHTLVRPKTAPERPTVYKRRKYHTWTAGIFFKKSKQRGPKKPKRTPPPPALLRRNSEKLNDIFDADDTVVLREDSPVGVKKQAAPKQALSLPSMQQTTSGQPSPTIDLDVAMDPFTDDRRHSEDQRSTTARIAKLHSSERRGMVDAFGVNHRRTESAPALSPVNRSALFGVRQHGSNASLSEDVFDEQEEDNFLAHEEEVKSYSASACQSSEAVNAKPSVPDQSGLGLTNMLDRPDDVIIVDPELGPANEDVRSSISTIEAPALLREDLPKRPATSPMPFAYPNPQLNYASSTEGRTTSASLISSPDADHVSFDAQSRQRRVCEQSTDYIRPSTDDTPSLCDSASSSAFPRPSGSHNARPSLEHRSNSMFVPGSSKLGDITKRNSLASFHSFHRFIPGSSHGSKLKLENISTGAEEKTKKKSNRISKLLFWRSKDMDAKLS